MPFRPLFYFIYYSVDHLCPKVKLYIRPNKEGDTGGHRGTTKGREGAKLGCSWKTKMWGDKMGQIEGRI